MSYDTVFTLTNIVVVPFWLIMILLPRWQWTERIIRSPLIILPPVLIYATLVLPQISTVMASLSNPTVEAVSTLLASPYGTTVGWAHFLAFDLFVGRWAYLDSRDRNIHPLWMVPVLFFIFMLGPVGFLLYIAVRLLYTLRRPVNTPVTA